MKKEKRRTRRVFRNFGYLECGAFAGYLHEMSLKGWHFREWRAGMLFEEGEPADITYCVEVFPKGSEMDTKPEEPVEEYAEYCRAAAGNLSTERESSVSFGRKRRTLYRSLRKRNDFPM